ncbi:MAG: HlyD family efflux transporter periplasmic adaptor subunit [Acidobacteria bacterium]|nr:HlyD family efflux transporter periplasmic adaptor subunit [Acidobacteriota bacterium]
MDVPRKNAARNRMIRRLVITAVVLVTIPAIHLGLQRLKPAAIGVEFGTLWPDTVKRGEMLRQVRGLGTLVPEEILSIPANTEGRVDRRLLLPGAQVRPDTVLLELSSPELQTNTIDAEWQLKAAEANYTDLKVRLESDHLNQEAALATVFAQYQQAKLEADRDEALYKEGLAVEIKAKISRNIADNLMNRHNIDKRRLEKFSESIEAQLAAQRTRVEQLRALYQLKVSQVEALKVRAGTEGVLQEVTVQVGQKVAAGTPLAKVVQPWRLKAELKIPETQAKDVLIGQPVQVDTRNGIIAGKVSRIDPAAQGGTVTVDAVLLEALPKGARPDLNVEGTIELERLNNVLNVGRPVFGQEKSTVTLFKVDADKKGATRVPVKLGRSSVSTIEIVEGLKVGDMVILSDMSAYDNHERISFK